jgi:hypothetical protein
MLAASTLALLQALPLTAAAADPSTGECLSAFERSIKLRNQHELTAAREQLLICASASCPKDVHEECASRVAEIGEQLPTLVFEAKDRAGNDLVAVTVSMDGAVLVERLDGTALPIDPGEHEFVFSIDRAPSVTKHLLVREGDKIRRESVVLGAEPEPVALTPLVPVASPPLAPGSPIAPGSLVAPIASLPRAPVSTTPPIERPATELAPTSIPSPPSAAGTTPSATGRTVGWVVAGLGVAALGVGIFEQVSARSRYSDSQRAAVSGDPAERGSTHGLYVEAQHAQTAAIVFAALGAVALGSGAYLVVSSMLQREPRRDVAVAPWISTLGGGVSYARAF